MPHLRRATVLIGAIIVLFQMSSVSAFAATAAAPAITITTVVENDILWFETEVDAAFDGKLRTKILAPKRHGGHRVWQTCSFHDSGAGVYRCGIDIADGSMAKEVGGKWVVKAIVGSEQLARHSVSI